MIWFDLILLGIPNQLVFLVSTQKHILHICILKPTMREDSPYQIKIFRKSGLTELARAQEILAKSFFTPHFDLQINWLTN